MWKVVRKNKSYDKRCLKIYYHDKLINTARAWGGWFAWDEIFENIMMHYWCSRKVHEDLYWLIGKDCDIAEWTNHIDKWDRGTGVDGKMFKESVFFNVDDKITALESFEK